MGPAERAASAAFALATLLALPPVLPRTAAWTSCSEPREELAGGGHSTAVRCAGAASGRPLRGTARLLFGLPLDPNRADRASLEALPGIGPARAAAIEAARCRRPFLELADLERVPGIGPLTRARVEPWLALEAPAEARCAVQ
jgi:hypothetical protein